MTLDRPWALALLAVPIVLLWLRLRDARPREAEASSLLVWRRVAPADAAPSRPRPPLAAWIEAAGAALLVLGLADPGTEGPAPSSVRALVDASPSMQARGADGRTRLEAVRAAISAGAVVEEAADLEGRLPGALAAGGPLVVVTDRRLSAFPDDPPRLAVVGVGERGFNAGITAGSGEPAGEGRWRLFLTVEAHGAPGPVEGRFLIGESSESITLTPGTPLALVREVPSRVAEASIAFPGDRLPSDDRVVLTAKGGELVEGMHPAYLRDSALPRALAAAGAELEWMTGGEPEILLRPAGSEETALAVRLPSHLEAAAGPDVSGAAVVAAAHPLVRDVRIDPASTLGRRQGGLVKIPAGADTLLSDGDGPLVLLESSSAHFGEGPRAGVVLLFLPGGTWVERDPSFVVFAKNLVDFAAGGPARVEATGVLDPDETREAAEGEAFGDLAEALDAARRPDPAARMSIAPYLFAAAAAALAAAWWLARG